jgi:hypothetical protein
MKKIIFVTIFLSVFVFRNYAQNDLEKEIMSVSDSSEMIVRNSRKLVNTKLHEHNFKDIPKIIAYAKTNADRYQYIAFYPWEEQVLSLLAEDLDYFFISATDDKFNAYAIQPPVDYMGQYAISIITGEKDLWIGWYNDLDISDEKKQVVRIFLGAIGLFDDDIENKKVLNKFLREYPNSEYKKYVSSFKNSFFEGSFEFEFGGGIWSLNGDLTQYVTPKSAFCLGMGGFVNRFYWSLHLISAGNTDLMTPLTISSNDVEYNLESGENLSLISCGGRFGWLCYRNSWVKVFPVADIAGLSLELPALDGRNDETVTITSNWALGAGLCSDFDIIHWMGKEPQSKDMPFHLGLRLSAGYQSYLSSKKNIGGNGYYCTASLFWSIGTM